MRIRLQLAQDFTAEVFKVFKEQPGTLISDAIRIATDRPAPRFYVRSYDVAILYIGRLMRGKPLPISNPNKVAMYNELYRRYILRHAGKRINEQLLREIAAQPAPSFYCTYNTLNKLFYLYQSKSL